jgi:hypothetical protein
MPTLPPGFTGKVVPQNPSWVARASQSIRYAITGVGPDNWFGPWQPLAPFASQDADSGVRGRRYDYPTGRNLNYIPRGDTVISFKDLRAISYNCEILRGVIEARCDQIAAMDWVIRPRLATTLGAADDDSSEGAGFDDPADNAQKLAKANTGAAGSATGNGKGGPGMSPPRGMSALASLSGNNSPVMSQKSLNSLRVPRDTAQRIKKLTDFFTYPDKVHTWDQWTRAINEDMFVLDAATIWKRRTRGGDLYSLEFLAGETIFPLIDAQGRRPTATGEPAFQQILHGIPAADYTADELLYMPRNVKTNRLYGVSPVEQVVLTANTAIRRAVFQLEYYLSGSNPDAFVGLPETWNLQNIKDFQQWFDGLMEGNLANRRKTRFMPGQFKYVETKEPPLKDEYDEWLARVICFVFDVDPEPFISKVSRASGGSGRARALEEGKLPLQRWWKQIMDQIIRFDMKEPDLEFVFLEDREQDPKTQMDIDTGYVKAGIYSIDEVRGDRGRKPLGGVAETPMLATTSGYVPLGALTGANAVAAMASQGSPAATTIHGTSTGDSHGVGPAPAGGGDPTGGGIGN